MSLRIDASEWISGALLIGETGLGVLAENVPSTGTSGASYLYNDLILPADNGKEICGQITSWPSAGTLFAYEDGSFSFTGAPDGAYSFDYQLYVDGVDSGSTTVTLTVGSGVITHATTGALVNGGATINGNALHTVPGAGVYPPQAQVLSGVVYGPTGAEFTGTMSILLDLNTGRLVKIIGQKVALLL